jgi:HK97 family phage prohead protease
MEQKQLTGWTAKGPGSSYWIIASTEDIDRDGEKILLSAWEKSLGSYLKRNPVILPFHRYDAKPIGRCLDGAITGKELRLEIEFAPTEEAQEIKALYDGKFLNSWSVGFIPKDWEADKETGRRIYKDVELLECSAVSVPSNAAATMIRQAKAAGIELKHLSDWYGTPPPMEEDTTMDDAQEILLDIANIWKDIEALEQRRLKMEMEEAAKKSASRYLTTTGDQTYGY